MSDETMQVEALESIKSAGFIVVEGDRLTVPKDVGVQWISSGWARDVAGEIPTGERRVVKSVVEPANVRHQGTNTEAK